MTPNTLNTLGRSLRLNHALLRSYLGYAFKRTKAPMPCFFNVDPSSACNLRCLFCPQSDPPPHASFGLMKLELFEEIVEQIRRHARCAGITLSLAGEPLLNAHLPRMVETVVRRLSQRPQIMTNGVLLSRERAAALIEAGAGSFMIDFCADREHFESMCPPAGWEPVRDNIRSLAEIISERHARTLIKIKNLDWRGDSRADHERSLSSLEAIFGVGSPFVYLSYMLHNWGGEFAAGAAGRYGYRMEQAGRRRFHPCSHLWLMMNIHYNGNVSICCRDTMQGAVVGNIAERPLPEIWNGPDFVRMRELMARGDYRKISICRDCDRIWSGGYSGGSPSRIARAFIAKKLRRRR